jgi:hypothetical protein
MTRNQQFLMVFCALLLTESGGSSANVIETISTATSNEVGPGFPVTLTFANPASITNATELLSISAGTVSGDEGGNFLLDVQYQGGSTQQIFSTSVAPGGTPVFDLSTIANEAFTEGTVTGLVFDASNTPQGGTYFFDIPAGTELVFATAPVSAVPEPASLTLFGSALAFFAAAWRRRTRRGSSTA